VETTKNKIDFNESYQRTRQGSTLDLQEPHIFDHRPIVQDRLKQQIQTSERPLKGIKDRQQENPQSRYAAENGKL